MTSDKPTGKQVEPYLFFDGRCEEAIQFYQKTIGAELLALMRFKESPDQSMNPPGTGEKVMHALIRIGDSQIMASDGQCSGKANFAGFGLSLSAKTVDEAKRLFNALSEGGQAQMPFMETFFAHGFGMVNDQFGVLWMVIVPKEMPQK